MEKKSISEGGVGDEKKNKNKEIVHNEEARKYLSF